MNVQKEINCPGCGARNLGIQERCLICGAKLPASATPSMGVKQPQAASTCKNCGADLKSGNRFCTKCGTPTGV